MNRLARRQLDAVLLRQRSKLSATSYNGVREKLPDRVANRHAEAANDSANRTSGVRIFSARDRVACRNDTITCGADPGSHQPTGLGQPSGAVELRCHGAKRRDPADGASHGAGGVPVWMRLGLALVRQL